MKTEMIMETENKGKVLLTINSQMIALTSIVLTVLGMLWNAFYGYGMLSGRVGALEGDIKEMRVAIDKGFERLEIRMDKLENRMEKIEDKMVKIEDSMHKIDLRVTTLEQKP